MAPPRPPLVAASHGTASDPGQRAVRGLVTAVAERLPDVVVREAFVDVQQPEPARVLADTPRPAVLVPLLLSAGYHVFVDLTDAARLAPGTVLAGALGPDERLADALARRLSEAGLQPDDAVVLVAAGSSEPLAVKDCRRMGDLLSDRLGRPVTLAYLSAVTPSLPDAVQSLRGTGAARVVAATYLLAPGYFADLAAAGGADVTTRPLLLPDEPPSAELVEIVVERYLAAERRPSVAEGG